MAEIKTNVYVCGENIAGQLGINNVVNLTKFQKLENLNNIVKVRAGGLHTVCLDSKGNVYTFGCNDEFALGRKTNDENDEACPTRLNLPEKVVDISCGDCHTVFLYASGTVAACGLIRVFVFKIYSRINYYIRVFVYETKNYLFAEFVRTIFDFIKLRRPKSENLF
ncbi:hypothetical protein [Neodiprion abietis nucleopolyhedrovirus]|uniref:Uncharacterized protein n=1 Tax=Neodiprion abietis nucleopolyhedrovirus TaxID=204507 RepID=Q0ZP07_9CBAC|nr:hypothetical protein [Neodiprion abietis nucleopolyhedrovirus]ABC74947.1 unknown [Neodiprion abietis nucleopolyhedrovirus]